LAKLGYVVFSADLFGKGVMPKTTMDAATKLGLTGRDRALVRNRMAAARDALERVSQVDPKRVAAVGFGVGGTAVLELARNKAELDGVVCVHGDLTPTGADGKNVSASLLVILKWLHSKTRCAREASIGNSSAMGASPAISRTRRPAAI
jgi:dienelactone hydrolase